MVIISTFNIATALEVAIKREASDVHLRVDAPVSIAKDGKLTAVSQSLFTSDDAGSVFRAIVPERLQAEAENPNRLQVDFAIEHSVSGSATKARFRVNAFKNRGTWGFVLRRLPHTILTPDQLGAPKQFSPLVKRPRGLLLVTGPTGSGKTTSLASHVRWVIGEVSKHVITIEEPVEYTHPMYTEKTGSIVTQREVGTDVPDFAMAMTAALRQKPNIIVLGEMRDLETTSTAITAAETGHLVLATLHTNTAASTISRIIDQYPAGQQAMIRAQLSNSLVGILCQQLLPKIGGGMVPAFEFLYGTPAVRNLIRQNKLESVPDAIQKGGQQYGMIRLNASLVSLVRDGKVTSDDALGATDDPAELEAMLARPRQ